MESSEFLQVAEKLFWTYGEPMSARRLVELGRREGLFSDRLSGETPWQTMKAKLSVHIRRHGERSRFVRTEPGVFFLRALVEDPTGVYHAPPWRPPPSRELVMVFPSDELDSAGRFQGVRLDWQSTYEALFTTGRCQPMSRLNAEGDERYKQVLTYILVTRATDVLVYKRGVYNRVEEMLRGAHCVGFGGHVIASDGRVLSSDDLGIRESAARELMEELKLPRGDAARLRESSGLEIVGLLNDDSSAAGRRHFAVLLRYEVTGDEDWNSPARGEESITQLRWMDVRSEDLRFWTFEYWSQLFLRALFPTVVKAQPAYMIRRKQALRPPHVVCMIGPIGSGKSEATRVFKERYGYEEINSGHLMSGLVGLPPVPSTPRQTFSSATWEFIGRPDGPRRLAEAIADAARSAGGRRIIVDGVRQRETVEALRAVMGKHRVAVVYVHTPLDLAYEFYRRRESKSATMQEFMTMREMDVEKGVDELIGESDAVLYNWVGIDNYRDTVRAFMAELGLAEVRVGSS
jgi:predicted NUDIX family phosphoesterase/dephospho-CoA kinase